MKILMVTSTFLPKIGGIENYIKELCIFLNRIGIKSDVLVVNKKINSFVEKNIEDIKVFYIPGKGFHPFYYFENLNNFVDMKDYNIIHIHDPHVGGISFHFKLNNYNKPLILTSHGGIFHTKNKMFVKKIYWSVIAREIIKIYNKIIAISLNDYKNFKNISNNVMYIPNGINFKKFNKIFNYFDIKKSFIYFGRFSSNKGIENLLKVFEILINKDNSYKLTLIGRSENNTIDKLIKFYLKKYSNNILIKDFLSDEDLLSEISKHTFYISATKFEGFGIAIFEAISSGRVAILNNIEPLNEIFSEKEILFCDFENIFETANKIDLLCNDLSRIEEMRKSSLKIVQNFSWENILPKIVNVYKECLDDKR